MNSRPGAPSSRSLFDAADFWESTPDLAFTSLLNSTEFHRTNESSSPVKADQAVRHSSILVYQSMFAKFLARLAARGTNFLETSTEDFDAFIKQDLEKATQETVWRYVRLIERVFQHLELNMMVSANPVSNWVSLRLATEGTAKAGKEQAPPDMVTRAEIWGIQDWLYSRGRAELAAGNWRGARDLTMSSLSLGSGMRCAELLKLVKHRVRYDQRKPEERRFVFDLPISGSVETTFNHATVAHPSAVDLMTLWWRHRWEGFPMPDGQATRTTSIPQGELVFPSTLTGKAMDATTVFKNLKKWSEIAVLDGVLTEKTQWILARGAQGLRRAYALSEIESESSSDGIKFRMGLWDARSVRRYSEQVQAARAREEAERRAREHSEVR
ncbi:integrase [Roseateles asaccharophilus]|uniref:hypothetical protein n=1 Tax=Roseateles asaccharophilus TaxID=582607 RepID=UPI003833210C